MKAVEAAAAGLGAVAGMVPSFSTMNPTPSLNQVHRYISCTASRPMVRTYNMKFQCIAAASTHKPTLPQGHPRRLHWNRLATETHQVPVKDLSNCCHNTRRSRRNSCLRNLRRPFLCLPSICVSEGRTAVPGESRVAAMEETVEVDSVVEETCLSSFSIYFLFCAIGLNKSFSYGFRHLNPKCF